MLVFMLPERTRADRQTLMFSATWPAAIQTLAMDFLCCPARVTIGSKDLSASHSIAQVTQPMLPGAGKHLACAGSFPYDVDAAGCHVHCRLTRHLPELLFAVCQTVEVLEPAQRDGRLDALLRQHQKGHKQRRILVFVLYKKEAARVEALLLRKGFQVGCRDAFWCSVSAVHVEMLTAVLSVICRSAWWSSAQLPEDCQCCQGWGR